MANFCTNCGKPLNSNWKYCPYCQHTVFNKQFTPSYSEEKTVNFDHYYVTDEYSEDYRPFSIEKSKRKHITKSQKIAIVIGIVIIVGAIVGPISGIAIYQYLFPQKSIYFFVDNGQISTSYTISTSRETLDYYGNLPHPSHTHWDPYYTAEVIESYCNPNDTRIINIAQDINSKCIDQNDDEEIINALLSFTQGIGYKAELTDLGQYSLETIFYQGDCEDLSILFGSLVVSLGYDAILVIISVYDQSEGLWYGHAAVGVYLNFTPTEHTSYPPSHYFYVNSKEYWICETTYQGWMIGELPASNPSYYVMEGYEFIQ
ncbi:MAG: zinc ribbon domain-containing protein [Promethearchaeota archaeon]